MDAKPPILEFLRIVGNTQYLRFQIIKTLLFIFSKLRKTSDFGVFAVDTKPPSLEFLRIVGRRKTSDFGVLNIINYIFNTICKTSDFGVFAVDAKPILEVLRIVRRTSDFGVLNIINNIFKTTQNLRFWSFCGGRKTSDFGVFAQKYAKPPILEY